MKTSYDRSTDSLSIELRPLPSVRTREVEPDVFLDIGADGKPVGYDIQHASTRKDLIARLVLGEEPTAAEPVVSVKDFGRPECQPFVAFMESLHLTGLDLTRDADRGRGVEL